MIGSGINGRVDGRQLAVGSMKYMRDLGIDISPDIEAAVHATVAESSTPVLVAVGGRAAAVAGLGDPLRPDAADAVDRLQWLGWKVRILSGDHPDVVVAIGWQLGIAPEDAIGGASPEQKLAAVRNGTMHESVIMVGDGVNDAAALSAASVGIAVHGGAEASLAASHVYLDRPGLTPILELIAAARATLRAIRRCFVASIVYNSIAGILAVTGLISPLAAAVLMPISSFTAFALAYRARTFGDGQ
jgi:Cu2+-exporting ATPase